MGRGGGGGGGHVSSGRSSSGGHSFSGRSGSSSGRSSSSSFSRPSSSSLGRGGSSLGGSSPRRVAPPPPRPSGGFGAPPPPPRPMHGYGAPPPPPMHSYGAPPPPPRTVIVHDTTPRYSSYDSGYSSRRVASSSNNSSSDKSLGAIGTLTSAFIVMLILTIIIAVFTPSSKTAVEKLADNACTVHSYDEMIVDDLGWVTEDGSSGTKKVKEGLEYFYQKTGVQPMFVLTDKFGEATADDYTGAQVEDALENLYVDTFGQDEGHLIFLVLTNDGADRYSYQGSLTGTSASHVIGDTQKEIIYDSWDINWDNLNQTEAEMIANTFKRSADKIMKKPSGMMAMLRNMFVLCDVALLIALVAMFISHNKTKRQAEENRHIEAVNEQYNKSVGSDSSLSKEDEDLLNKYK